MKKNYIIFVSSNYKHYTIYHEYHHEVVLFTKASALRQLKADSHIQGGLKLFRIRLEHVTQERRESKPQTYTIKQLQSRKWKLIKPLEFFKNNTALDLINEWKKKYPKRKYRLYQIHFTEVPFVRSRS